MAWCKIAELSDGGEIPVKQKKRGFFIGDGVRQVLDPIASIFKAP